MKFLQFALPLSLLFVCSCATVTPPPSPAELSAPSPIEGNSGKFMCPYTSDGTVCAWVEAGKNAKMGAQLGSALGSYAGQKAMEQVPFVGGFLGQKAGAAIGREVAIKSMGGMDAIKNGSDLSFNSIDNLIVYIYVNHSTHADYQSVTQLIGELYPDFKTRQLAAIHQAARVSP